jgi:hypothetical protein
MTIRIALWIVLLAVPVFAQTDLATAKRAKNGKLISLTNLSGLKECGVRNVEGKVRDIRIEEETAVFEMGKKDKMETVSIDLKRLAEADRKDLPKQLVKEGLLLRVSGYTCGSDGVIEAISIDRSY